MKNESTKGSASDDTEDELLHHERMDVYRVASELVVHLDEVIAQLPRGRANLRDQLERVSTSVINNLGEGLGEYAAGEKLRFYRYSLRSVSEALAATEKIRRLELVDAELIVDTRRLCRRCFKMISRLTVVTQRRK